MDQVKIERLKENGKSFLDAARELGLELELAGALMTYFSAHQRGHTDTATELAKYLDEQMMQHLGVFVKHATKQMTGNLARDAVASARGGSSRAEPSASGVRVVDPDDLPEGTAKYMGGGPAWSNDGRTGTISSYLCNPPSSGIWPVVSFVESEGRTTLCVSRGLTPGDGLIDQHDVAAFDCTPEELARLMGYTMDNEGKDVIEAEHRNRVGALH